MIRVLVDDLREFRDGRARLVARTSAEGVALLESLRGSRIDELWLDHDLGLLDGRLDDIRPVVSLLEEAAVCGEPFEVGLVLVHTSNPSAAATMVQALERQGYPARRVDAVQHFVVE